MRFTCFFVTSIDFTALEKKDGPLDFVVTELSETEVVFIDMTKPDDGFLRYNVRKKDMLEFFSYEPEESVHFLLFFKRVHED